MNYIIKVFIIILILIVFYLSISNTVNLPIRHYINYSMSNIFKEIIEILNKNNIEYFIIYGTLLGKCRHDSIIPWDDDLDIAFNINPGECIGLYEASRN